ncbi:MAG: hypothetical protein K2Y22_02030 [Candidatus Obscuribacterales bacterium]|nr:hypothetical protein [Candidatus Obscuribacterales bacterium]
MRNGRGQRGSQLAEFGPAMGIFILLIVFPLINFAYIGCAYGASWFLNHIMVRELALTNPKDKDAVEAAEDRIGQNWANTGLASLIGITPANYSTKVTNKDLTYTPSQNPDFVRLTSEVKVKPLVPMQAFADVPGLGADLTFSFTEEQPLEEKGLD